MNTKDFLIKPTIKFSISEAYDLSDKTISKKVFRKAYKKFKRSGTESFFNCVKTFKDFFYYGNYFPTTTLSQHDRKEYSNTRIKRDKNSLPNPYGIYNMIGNVAEMVREKNISKGGSWENILEDSKIRKKSIYDKPSSWIGFRCICEVKLKPASIDG